MVNKIAITWGLIIIVIFAVFLGVVYVSQSWVSVGVGHALLVIDMGNSGAPIENRISVVLGPATGFFVNGWNKMVGLQQAIDIYYATDVFDGVIPCFSADQLEMNITIQMRWSLNTTRLIQLYKNYPKLDYEQTAIDSIMEKNIRFVSWDVAEHREGILRRELPRTDLRISPYWCSTRCNQTWRSPGWVMSPLSTARIRSLVILELKGSE